MFIFDFSENNISVSAKHHNDLEARLTEELVYKIFNIKNTVIKNVRS